MKTYKAPILNNDLVCIASSDVDIELISTICCYINDPHKYFPIFSMPVIKKPILDTYNIEDDDFTSIILNKATIQMMNSIARIRYRKILLVGLSDLQKKYLNLEKYWKVTFIEINCMSDISEKLKFLNKQFNGTFYCQRNEISRGLFCAKNEDKLLKVDDNAPSINDYIENNGEGILFIESKNDLTDMIIINYAFSINVDVKFIHELKATEIKDLRKRLIEWKRDKSYGAYLNISTTINEFIKDINIKKYKYITFFTDGVPYGVFFNSIIPCSHVLRSITVDLFIYNNIFYEQYDNYFGSAIIFSPNPPDLSVFTKMESEKVCNILKESNLFVKKLLNKNATVEAFDSHVGYYPYDVFHICSHGGETDGYYVIQEFKDRNGERHVIEYEEVVGFSPDEGEYINVVSKKIFRFFNGFIWKSDELKNQNYPQYVYDDMFKALYNEEEGAGITRTKIDYLIEGSCYVQCYDDIHQGQFHALASQNYPLIFNNTCNSWEEFATHLIAGGCRAYIGTLWNIGNESATSSSQKFYNNVFDMNIINAVNIMNNEIHNDKFKDIYLFCGLHFASLKKPPNLSEERVIRELAVSLKRWLDHNYNQKSPQVIRNSIKIIQFLCKELTPYFELPGIIELLVRASRLCNYLKGRLL